MEVPVLRIQVLMGHRRGYIRLRDLMLGLCGTSRKNALDYAACCEKAVSTLEVIIPENDYEHERPND